MIETDVRYVKLSNGYYHAKTKTKPPKDLCRFCGLQHNCKKLYRAAGEVHNCKEYKFPIAFREAKGLEDRYNTMRLGKTWSKRLATGDAIILVNSSDSKPFGRAIVQSVHCQPTQEALEQHGANNHLMIAKPDYRPDLSVSGRMERILRNSYGNRLFDQESHVTTIYLQTTHITG